MVWVEGADIADNDRGCGENERREGWVGYLNRRDSESGEEKWRGLIKKLGGEEGALDGG